MGTPVLNNVFKLFAVTLCVTWFTFLMLDLLPGDAAYQIAGQNATVEEIREIREDLGLDRNVFLRYLSWCSRVCRGNWACPPSPGRWYGMPFRNGCP